MPSILAARLERRPAGSGAARGMHTARTHKHAGVWAGITRTDRRGLPERRGFLTRNRRTVRCGRRHRARLSHAPSDNRESGAPTSWGRFSAPHRQTRIGACAPTGPAGAGCDRIRTCRRSGSLSSHRSEPANNGTRARPTRPDPKKKLFTQRSATPNVSRTCGEISPVKSPNIGRKT